MGNINTNSPTSNSEDRPHAPSPEFSGYTSRSIDWGNSESTVTVEPNTAVLFHGNLPWRTIGGTAQHY